MSEHLDRLGSEPDQTIEDLREAMRRVRIMHETGSMALGLAQFEAESSDANKEFLADFLEILPVEFRRLRFNHHAHMLATDTSLDAHIASIYGITLVDNASIYSDNTTTVLLIGERELKDKDEGLTQVLGVGTKYEDKKTVPQLYTFTVASKSWQQMREQDATKLVNPPGETQALEAFNSSIKKFVISKDSTIRTITGKGQSGNDLLGYREIPPKPRRLMRHSNVPNRSIAYSELKERDLRNSDFEEFGVMHHMETIVAAFGVGEKFDVIKQKRYSRLPTDPATTILGLPADYRLAVEQASVHALAPVSEV